MVKNIIGSTRFKLNSIDWKKIGKGFIIALIGAGLTYLTDLISLIEFGVITPAVMMFWSVFTNFAWKLLRNNTN